MASKIDGRNFDAPITAYTFEGKGYNTLRVNVDYQQNNCGGGYLTATLTPESIEITDSGYRVRSFAITGTRDPLGSWTTIKLKDAPRNSRKTIEELSTALEVAKADIAWLFDQRMWPELQQFVKDVALCGYTSMLEERIKGYKNFTTVAAQVNAANNDNQNQKEDKDMTTTFKAADLIGKTIILGATGAKYVVKSIDGDKLECDFSNGKATIPMGVPVCQAEKFLASGTWKIEGAIANENDNENDNKATATDLKPADVKPETKDMSIRTEADVAEVDDILPVVTPKEKSEVRSKKEEVKPAAPETRNLKPEIKVKPEAKAKPAENTGKTKIVVARVPRPGESADKPTAPETRNLKPETKQAAPASLPTLTLSVYTTRRGEQAPRIDGFGGEEDPRWKRHYDEKMRLSKEKEQAKKKNEKIRQQMKGKSAEEKEALLKKIIHVGSDPFGASYFTDRTNGEKTYYFCMGAKYMDVAQQLVDAYNSGDEQAIAQAEQAVIDCKSGIVAEIEASRNADGDKVETLPETKTEGKTYSEAYIADLLTRATKQDAKALAELNKIMAKAA